MSIWNAVLQASHSSLIDQLNETFPADKLELGLPKRFDSWGVTDGPEHLFFQEIVTREGTGVLVLGIRKNDLKVGADVFTQALVRVEKEFRLRKIEATFGEQRAGPPSSLRMTIWLPIRIVKTSGTAVFDLAVGV